MEANVHEMETLHRKLNIDIEKYRKDNQELQKDSERMIETLGRLTQEKEVYKKRIFSPKMPMDLSTLNKSRFMQDEIDSLKEVMLSSTFSKSLLGDRK